MQRSENIGSYSVLVCNSVIAGLTRNPLNQGIPRQARDDNKFVILNS